MTKGELIRTLQELSVPDDMDIRVRDYSGSWGRLEEIEIDNKYKEIKLW